MPPLVFPIEVYPDLSADQYQQIYSTATTPYPQHLEPSSQVHAKRSFVVNDPALARSLFLQGHRLGYTDHHPSSKKDGKAFVRLNDGPWLPLSNDNVTLPAKEKNYGGIGGGFRTNHLTIDLAKLGGPQVIKKGMNFVSFRMGQTDGVTNGFRILDLQIFDRSQNNLIANPVTTEDPNQWQPPLTDSDSVEFGKGLFSKRNILIDGGRSIRASCNDCHSQDGRDLEYFAYSNGSIVARSLFHGLSFKQGQAIASYIRSLNAKGVPRVGRPWNPPYQPGPGIDSRPVQEWAAGAGLNAVVPTDADTKDFLFPEGTSTSAISDILKNGTTDIQQINTREIPVSIQLPDWNDWLPTIHPVDVWGDYYVKGMEGNRKGFFAVEKQLREALRQGRYGYKKENSAGFLLERLTKDAYDFMGKGARVHDYPLRIKEGTITDRRSPRISQELANNAMAKTIAVRTFDVMQRLQIADKAKKIYGADLAEDRQWPVRKFSVFQVAPHIYSLNRLHFTSDDLSQSVLKGEYDSVAWYHAQIVLNSGGKVRDGIYPVDWDYQYNFINRLYRSSKVKTPYLHMLTLIKGMQNNTGPFGIGRDGFMIRFTKPHWMLRETLTEMTDVETRNSFMEAFLLNYIEIMRDRYGIMRWDSHRFTNFDDPLMDIWTNIISRDATPGEFVNGQVWHNDNANNAYNMAQFFHNVPSITPETLMAYLSLVKNLWPKGDFESFTPFENTKIVIPRGTPFIRGETYATTKYQLVFQKDGNLVLHEKGRGVIWSTGSGGGLGDRAFYQDDGNLVVYDKKDNPVYASNTKTTSPLVLTDLAGLMIDENILSRTLVRDQPGAIREGSVFQAGRYKVKKTGRNSFAAYHLDGKRIWKGRGLDEAEQLVLNDNGLVVSGRRVFGKGHFNPTKPDGSQAVSSQWPPVTLKTPDSAVPPAEQGQLFPLGYEFTKGEVHSQDKQQLVFETNGNLVIRDEQSRLRFGTQTENRGHRLYFQSDGNLVIYDEARKPLFASNTYNRGKALVFRKDGQLVVLDANNIAIWKSHKL